MTSDRTDLLSDEERRSFEQALRARLGLVMTVHAASFCRTGAKRLPTWFVVIESEALNMPAVSVHVILPDEELGRASFDACLFVAGKLAVWVTERFRSPGKREPTPAARYSSWVYAWMNARIAWRDDLPEEDEATFADACHACWIQMTPEEQEDAARKYADLPVVDKLRELGAAGLCPASTGCTTKQTAV